MAPRFNVHFIFSMPELMLPWYLSTFGEMLQATIHIYMCSMIGNGAYSRIRMDRISVFVNLGIF